MNVVVRPAELEDAPQMVTLLNAIIEKGGTTAQQSLFDDDRMIRHYLTPKRIISCQVAVEGDELLGFQSLDWADPSYAGPNARPNDWGVIASFVKEGQQGKGVGAALFNATYNAGTAAGVVAIDATIRADNRPGLNYYEKMGFREDSRLLAVPLRDGTIVDRVRKVLAL